jgi:hypothetical protein
MVNLTLLYVTLNKKFFPSVKKRVHFIVSLSKIALTDALSHGVTAFFGDLRTFVPLQFNFFNAFKNLEVLLIPEKKSLI